MKADYWNVTDEQVVEKTGKALAHWRQVLDAFGSRTFRTTTACPVTGPER
jgi:hypothetical protein